MTGVLQYEAVDVEGAVRAYLNGLTDLVGAGKPLANGVHLGKARSPARGAIAELQIGGSRDITDMSDDTRLQFRVKAVGSELGARQLAEQAARALAMKMLAITPGLTAVTRRGTAVRFVGVGNPGGPLYTGDVAGEAQYTFEIDIRCQPGARAYGSGDYGTGNYGG